MLKRSVSVQIHVCEAYNKHSCQQLTTLCGDDHEMMLFALCFWQVMKV